MALKHHDQAPEVSRGTAGILDGLDDMELLDLRNQIDAILEIKHLGSLDIGQEIMVQLRTLKALQHKALIDAEAPHNQKAQAANTVSRMLQDLVRSRAKLYSAERAKEIEDMTIEAMKDAPPEAKEQFFGRLERLLKTLPTLDTLMAESE